MSGYALHPEAYDDLDEIQAYIAETIRTRPTGL
jgi:hypothetical protein